MRERLLQDTEDREDEELVQQGDLAEAPQQAADPERLSRESDALEVNGFKWDDLEHPPEPADGHVIEVVVPVLVIRVGIRATFAGVGIEPIEGRRVFVRVQVRPGHFGMNRVTNSWNSLYFLALSASFASILSKGAFGNAAESRNFSAVGVTSRSERI